MSTNHTYESSLWRGYCSHISNSGAMVFTYPQLQGLWKVYFIISIPKYSLFINLQCWLWMYLGKCDLWKIPQGKTHNKTNPITSHLFKTIEIEKRKYSRKILYTFLYIVNAQSIASKAPHRKDAGGKGYKIFSYTFTIIYHGVFLVTHE